MIEPAWVPLFLDELRRQKTCLGKIDVRMAADIAGVSRARVYCYRKTRQGARLRNEWDCAVLTLRRSHRH